MTSPVMERPGGPASPASSTSAGIHSALVVLVLISGCGHSPRDTAVPDAVVAAAADAPDSTPRDAMLRDATAPDAAAPCIPPSPNTAPTYTELYTSYFAANTPGHCATDNCHAGSNYNLWLCGATKDSCYQGMLDEHLIDPGNPPASLIADQKFSPLVWVNPLGQMPRDGTGPFPPGGSETIARNQIIAWANACAQNN